MMEKFEKYSQKQLLEALHQLQIKVSELEHYKLSHEAKGPGNESKKDGRSETEKILSGLMNNMDAGVVVHAADTSVILNNKRASELLGLTEEQMKGKQAIDPAWHFIDENSHPLPIEAYPVNKIIGEKKAIKNMLLGVVPLHVNEVVWLLANGFPVFDQAGNLTEAIINFIDITERINAAEALKERERLLNIIGDIAKIGAWEMDLERGGKATWTKGTYDIVEIGYEAPVPGFNEHLSWYLPEYRDLVEEKMNGLLENKLPMQFEARFKTKKGNIKWCRAYGKVVEKDGKVIKMRGTFQDITESRNIKEHLRESEELLSNAIDRAAIGMCLISPDGILKKANLAMCSMLGYSEAELIGLHFQDITHPEDKEAGALAVSNMMTQQQEHAEFEKRYLHKQGHIVQVYISSTLLRDRDGQADYFFTQVQDISHRRLLETRLADIQKLLNETQKIGKIGGWVFDVTEKTQTWTEEVYRIHEVAADFIPTIDNGLDFYPPDSRSIMEDAILRAINDGSPYDMEMEIISAKKNKKWVHIIGKPIIENGQTIKVTGSIHDITERKLAEKELSAYSSQLEERVKIRTEELEARNQELDNAIKVFVGREQTIRELQKKIRILKGGNN